MDEQQFLGQIESGLRGEAGAQSAGEPLAMMIVGAQ
jgi:hypothetical protein